MKFGMLAVCVWVVGASSVARAGAPAVAIVGATVVHPERTGGSIVDEDVTIVVTGDRITAVGPSKTTPAPKGATVIQAKGKWVVPGLIDSHVHFFQSGNPYTRPDAIDVSKIVPYADEVARNKARLDATFKVWLISGVTSVADVGGPFWNYEMRDRARKTAAAPRVAVAGPLFSLIDRPQLDLGDPPIIKMSSPADVGPLAKKELEKKPDFLKVWFIYRPGDDLSKGEAITKAVGVAAHVAKIRLAVHATELDSAKAALRAGADILVHSVFDKVVDDEFIALAKRNRAIYVPTLFVTDGYTLVTYNSWHATEPETRLADPQILAHMNDLEKVPRDRLPPRMSTVIRQAISFRPNVKTVGMDNLKKVWDAGITVAMGTDAGNIGTLHGAGIFREMELMVQSGLTMREVLFSATVNGAKVMGMERDLGAIAKGKLADLVILDADPLAGVESLSRIHRVVKNGVVYDPKALMDSIR